VAGASQYREGDVVAARLRTTGEILVGSFPLGNPGDLELEGKVLGVYRPLQGEGRRRPALRAAERKGEYRADR
jgi:hypothetical protein